MAKLRVHELAKQLGITSKEAIDHLERLGVKIRSHASTIEDYLIPAIERSMRGEAPPSREEAESAGAPSRFARRPRRRLVLGENEREHMRIPETPVEPEPPARRISVRPTASPAAEAPAEAAPVAEPVERAAAAPSAPPRAAVEAPEPEAAIEAAPAPRAAEPVEVPPEAPVLPTPPAPAPPPAVERPAPREGELPPRRRPETAYPPREGMGDRGRRPDQGRPGGRPDGRFGGRPDGGRPEARPYGGRSDGGRPGGRPDGRPFGGRPDAGRPGARPGFGGRVDAGRPGGRPEGRPSTMAPREGAAPPARRPDRDRDRSRDRDRDKTRDREWADTDRRRRPPRRPSLSSTGSEVRPAPLVGATVEITDPISVRDLARALGLDTSDILRELMMRGAPSTINASIGGKVAAAIGRDLGINVEIVAQEPEPTPEPAKVEDKRRERRRRKEKLIEEAVGTLVPVPPVVTVLGHVDHGKTTLLDHIRKTRVVDRESGGITQHIGASEIEHKGKKIVFIDTPGHAAFTAMRARGAQITDIAILVVAANDGVMPQTVEAINHAKAAGVPILVAVNKIDLPDAKPDRVLQQLSEHGLVPEAWGGDVVTVNVSALDGTNVDSLLDYILLISEVEELQAQAGVPGKGLVIEAQSDSSRGPVATVIVKEGDINVGDSIVCGATWGRVRAMVRPNGERVKHVGPGSAVEIMGLAAVPAASDELEVVPTAREARERAEAAAEAARARAPLAAPITTLEDLFSQVQAGQVRDLNLVVKADVQGTVEALCESIGHLGHAEIKVNVIHSSVGAINESDVLLASSTGAIIIAFRVGTEPGATQTAADEGVEIRSYEVIYEVIDDLRDAMTGMLAPVYREKPLGKAEVRALFRISRIGVIAGCHVIEGTLRRGEPMRVKRNGETIWQGPLTSLKHVKEDVREISAGYECGISVDGFNGFQEGDIIEVHTMERVTRTLQS